MTDCKFKVGEICRGRSGFQYKIIAIDTEAVPECQLVVRRLDLGYISTRRIDGRSYAQRDSNNDILPNKRKEWVVTYVFLDDMDERRSYRVFKECEKITAERCAKNLRELTAFRDVRGPMLWEYEE